MPSGRGPLNPRCGPWNDMFSQRGERRRCYAIVRRAGASHLLLGHSDWLVELEEVEVMPLWTVCQAQSCTRAGQGRD